MRHPWLLVLLLAMPSLAHAASRLDDVLDELRQQGYRSPSHAVMQVRAAADRPGPGAPVEQRMRYQAAVAHYAALSRQASMASAFDEARAALREMAREEDCSRCLTESLLAEAQAALARRAGDEAESALRAAEPRIPEAADDLAYRLHFLRGRLYYLRGDFAAGHAEMLHASELAGRQGDEAGRVMAQAFTIAMSASLGDHKRAEQIGRRAYQDAQRMGFTYALVYIHLNLSFNHARKGRWAQQAAALQEAYEISHGDPGLVEFEALSLSNLSDTALRTGDYARALDYARRAERLARDIGDRRTLSFALANAGAATARLGDIEAGLALVRQGIDLATELGAHGDVIGITAELVAIHKRAGRYREALEAFEGVAALQRQLTQQERDKTLVELQERYATQERMREIDRLSAANRIAQAELSANTFRQRMWVALSLLLALAAVVLVQWLKRVRRDNRRLSGDVAMLAEQSLRDPLTGVANRRLCKLLMARHAEQAGPPVPMGLVLLDLDLFKAVNDGWGHAAGDRVLVEVAARLRSVMRPADTVARWGGEEFALLLPGASPDSLAALAARALHAIGDAPVDIGQARIDITASVGATLHPLAPGADWQLAMHVADLALYLSKAEGRNRGTCVLDVAGGADIGVLSGDLTAAHARGEVRLQRIDGPRGRVPATEPAQPA